jgi:general secretion pathway protein G
MSKLKKRVLLVILGTLLTLVMLAFLGGLLLRTPRAIARTNGVLASYRAAMTSFFAKFGRWPTSSTELVSNSMGIIFIYPSPPLNDGWGQPIIYEPYATNIGFGRVLSYGRDGKPGGNGGDADIELRFP